MMNEPTDVSDKPFRAGVFTSSAAAERAVAALRDLGFEKQHIAVLCSDKSVQEHFPEYEVAHVNHNEAANSAIAGSVTGAVLGGVASAVVATATGFPLILIAPGLLGGGLAGGLVGEFSTRGVEKETADFYDQSLTAGELLVAVEYHGADAATKLEQAEHALREAGAKPVPLSEG